MRKKLKVLISLGLLILSLVGTSIAGFTVDQKDLLYDLKFDEKRHVLTGRTTPSANIYLENLAGSIVADEKGNFEVPIPKGTKEETIGMLDAEGDQSTSVIYDFVEKKVISSEKDEKSETSKPKEKKESDTKGSSSQSVEEDEEVQTNTSTQEVKESSTQVTQDTMGAEVVEESFTGEEKEAKLSTVWIWTIVIIVLVGGLGVGTYLWYQKKLEKEENDKHKRCPKRKRDLKSDGEEEEDFEDIMSKPSEKVKGKKTSKQDMSSSKPKSRKPKRKLSDSDSTSSKSKTSSRTRKKSRKS